MSLRVLATGPLATVQDEGRPGHAAWGVTRSGACDRASYRRGNRLVGNPPGAASLEVTLGGLVLRAESAVTVAVTGAPCPGAPLDAPHRLAPGDELRLGVPVTGVRTYVAVRGGIDVDPVLGSRSTDTLSGLGPAPLRPGDVLPVGREAGTMPGVDQAPARSPAGHVRLRVTPGPRQDRFGADALTLLRSATWTVGPDSDRIGVRLSGPPLRPAAELVGVELPSEGVLRGAVQVPPSGQPVVFLADAPVTGGYPVIAYVRDGEPGSDVDLLAQARPGTTVRLTG